MLFPVPWACEPSISHLATPDEMKSLLTEACFEVLVVYNSTDGSQSWFEAMTVRMEKSGLAPVTLQAFLGSDSPEMARNEGRNLAERRIRTVSYICEA